jgi:aminoglycoside 6'-N-acetyltransferase I
MAMQIRIYTPADHAEWLRMRRALWPHLVDEDEVEDAADWLARSDATVLVAVRPDGRLAGFAEVGSRLYAEGCDTSPVAYLEGWYVDDDVRGTGIGGALIRGAEEWARTRGYAEMGSDALLDNVISHRAHEAVGFTEVERTVMFRKSLREPTMEKER